MRIIQAIRHAWQVLVDLGLLPLVYLAAGLGALGGFLQCRRERMNKQQTAKDQAFRHERHGAARGLF